MNSCREWQGCRSRQGYGRKSHKGKTVMVHRWVVAQILGWEAIEGKVVRHKCDNPPCFRYDHLEVGTQAENMKDWALRGPNSNSRKTHCVNGHPFDEANTRFTKKGHRQCRACGRARGRKQ